LAGIGTIVDNVSVCGGGLCGIRAFCNREAYAFRLLVALAISIFLHLVLICFPARYAERGLVNARHMPERAALTPLLVTLQLARADLVFAETETALTQIATAQSALPVAVSTTPDSDRQPVDAGGSDKPVGTELVYYTTDKLSKAPEVIAMDDLNTAETRVYKVSGTLVMNLWIDDQGRVSKVLVEDSALPPVFAETAARIFKGALFSPGERSGLRVGTLMRIEVGYEDKGLPVAH